MSAPKAVIEDCVRYAVRLLCTCGVRTAAERGTPIASFACWNCDIVWRRVDTADHMAAAAAGAPSNTTGWTCAPVVELISRACDTCGRAMRILPDSTLSTCTRCEDGN